MTGNGTGALGGIAASQRELETDHSVEGNGTLERPVGVPTLERGYDRFPCPRIFIAGRARSLYLEMSDG